jgi:predicted DNA-binding transcriptional regulator YafY
MAKFKPQYRRLIFIDQKIRRGQQVGRYPNCRSLAEEYQVSRKTIQRDVDFMKNELDAPIEYDKVYHGYYYTEESYKLPAIRIKQSDLFAICIAEKVLQQYENTPIYDNLVSVFETLEKSMPEKVSVDPTWLHGRFSFFAEASPDMDHAVWQTVFEALRDSKRVSFSYRNPGWQKAYVRTVDPYHAVSYRAEWYLIGYCHYMKAVRSFAVSRMSGAKVVEAYFVPPRDFDFKAFSGSHFGIMFGTEEHLVRIRFDAPSAPYVLERIWHPSQQIEELDEGEIILTFTVNHLFEVKRWILSWGKGATVLEPPELVRMVTEDLDLALTKYEST